MITAKKFHGRILICKLNNQLSHLYFKNTSIFPKLKDSIKHMFPTSLKTTEIKKISIEATVELISLSWCWPCHFISKVNRLLKDRIINTIKQILVCAIWTTCLKKGFTISKSIKVRVYIKTCTTWYFIKKRIQNRLFQSQIPLLFFFPSHSLPPFCYNIHFHPHPTGLNPSFSSLLPTDGQLIALSQ